MAYAGSIGKKANLGAETSCNVTPAYISFCGVGSTVIENALTTVISHFNAAPGFDGVSVHYYDSYVALLAK